MPKFKEVGSAHPTITNDAQAVEWVVRPEPEEDGALTYVFRELARLASLKRSSQLGEAAELVRTVDESPLKLALEVLKKLAPDMLLVIKVPSDSPKLEIIYVHSRYSHELPEEQVLAFLESEKKKKKQSGTFWHRIMRADVISRDESGPLGMSQQIGDFRFNFAIDKVVDPQHDQVFLMLKGTEVPSVDPHTETNQQNRKLVEEIWQLSAAISELQNKHQDYVDETMWNEVLKKAVMDFLSNSSMKLYAAEKFKKRGETDKADERLREIKEGFEKLRALFEDQPARQEKKDVPLLK